MDLVFIITGMPKAILQLTRANSSDDRKLRSGLLWKLFMQIADVQNG